MLWNPRRVTTYIVGLDGSDQAQAALDWAQAVAAADDRIVVGHAWDVPVITGYEAVGTVDPLAIENVSEEFLDQASRSAAIPGSPAS